MATQSRNSGIPEFFADTESAEDLRRKFIEDPMEGSAQSALRTGSELANLMSFLPGAFVASQQRELERVKRSGGEKDPRVAALQASIEQADLLQTMALRGQVRVKRALVALTSNDAVFHGFVSDSELAPLKGLTVRLTDSKNPRAKTFSAVTDDDGYFSMALGTKSAIRDATGAKVKSINLSQRLAALTARLSREPGAPPPAGAEANLSQVEILSKQKLVFTDPVPVALDGGSIYREYAITDPSSPSGPRISVSKGSPDQPSPPVFPTDGVAEAAPTKTPSRTPAASAARRSAKKKSPRGAKARKTKSKK